MQGLRGKRVWVSGASGELGHRLVETFLALGCHVVASARRRTRLLDLRAELNHHERLHIAENDASDPEGVESLLDALCRREPLDIAVQCAGAFSYGPIRDSRDEDVRKLVDANLMSSAWLLRGCLRRMLPRGRGDIVLVAADKAVTPTAGFGFYGATKAAVAHLVEVARLETAGTQVRTWGLLPGTLDTETNRASGLDPSVTPMLPLSRVCSDVVALLDAPLDAVQIPALVSLPLDGTLLASPTP